MQRARPRVSDSLWVNAKADSTHFARVFGPNTHAIRPPKAGRTWVSAPEVSQPMRRARASGYSCVAVDSAPPRVQPTLQADGVGLSVGFLGRH